MNTKQCTKCKDVKLLSEFGTASGTKKDGHNSWCKQCCRKISRAHSRTPSGIYSTTKGSVNYYKNTTVEIPRKDFITWYNLQPKHCVYCNIPELDLKHMGNYYFDKCDRLTVDRMDNSIGYRNDNIVLSCYRCNMTKGDVFSFDEMVEIGHKYLESKWRANKEREEQS